MKRVGLVILLVLIAAAVVAQTHRGRAVRKAAPAAVAPALPYDVAPLIIAYDVLISPTEQPKFDQFSWQTFMALNQPAPGATATEGPRVWETYASVNDVFHPGAPSPCGAANAGTKVLAMAAKNEHVESDSDFLQATAQPLIDRNLNFVLYEIRMNDIEAGYIREKRLDTYEGQLAFQQSGQTLEFPASVPNESYGAMEIKAAWRILGQNDTPSRYFTRRANIAIPASSAVDGKPVCAQNVLVGLVGLHIVRKTAQHPEWVWSSFEHVDNVPNATSEPTSFFDENCDSCPLNEAPQLIRDEKNYRWEAAQPYAARYAYSSGGKQYGTQVVRANEIYPFTEGVTLNWWQDPSVKGTVWQNYQLIGSQWRVHTTDNPPTTADIPRRLANSTMETYIQRDASCLGCHEHATTSVGQCSDFSFVFAAAHLRPTPGRPKALVTAEACGSDTTFRAKPPARSTRR